VRSSWRSPTLTLVVLLWTGVLFGVSFLATPAKFQAPSLSLAVAVDVGRATFHLLNRVEMFFAVLAAVLAAGGGCKRLAQIGVAIAAVLTALETFWLLPALDERAELVIAGLGVEPSRLHDVYIGLDLTKLAVLLMAGVVLIAPKREEEDS